MAGRKAMLAIETIIEAVARRLCLAVDVVRRRNFYGIGRNDVTPYGMTVEDNIIERVVDELDRTVDLAAWRRAVANFNRASPVLKKGLATMPVKFGISFNRAALNQAGALVHVYTDGSVVLNHGGTEMGQGLFIKVAQVVAEVFADRSRPRPGLSDQHGQGAEHVGDGGIFGLRSQRHGGHGMPASRSRRG